MSGEFLEPLPLRPDPPPDAGGSHAGPWRMVLAALLLLALGLGLIAWLGRKAQTEPPPPVVPPAPTPVPEPSPTPDPTARLAAEAALEALMSAFRPLRARKAELWGGQAWTNAVSAAAAGDDALARRNHGAAQAAYEAALSALASVAAEQASAPGRMMARAESAYARGDAIASVAALEAVLALVPAHPAASALLPRARHADKTFAALQSAKQKFQAGDPAQAWVDVQRAEQGDATFPGLSTVRAEVSAALSEAEFTRLISEGLNALAAGDPVAAEPLIRRAVAFQPENPAALDALRQLEDALRQRRVLALRLEAERLENDGYWRQAYERYLEILSLDATAPFSLEGRERTRTWLVWEERMRKLSAALNSPEAARLDRELGDQDLAPWPAGLRRSAEDFRQRFALEQTPVPVLFRSDAETEVTILQHSRLDPFIEKTVALKPGTYVARGSRLGYRDVRVTFAVPPGGPGGTVDVRCVEGIH